MKRWKTSDTLVFAVVWATLLIVASLAILYLKGLSPKLDGILRMLSAQTSQTQAPAPVHGKAFDFIAFDPFVLDGQKPGATVPREQIERLVDGAARVASGIRTYGMGDGLDGAIEYAHGKGLATIAGIWLSADPAANELEMERAIALAATGAADILCVGNECLLRGDLPEDELLAYIARCRERTGARIAYADTPGNYSDALLRAIDVALPNIHPYWAGRLPQEGAGYVIDEVNALAARAAAVNPGLAVIVGETGFPNTVPGWEQFWEAYLSSDAAPPAVAFMLTDCPWKAEGGSEAEGHWGLLDLSDGLTLLPKPEIDAVFGRLTK